MDSSLELVVAQALLAQAQAGAAFLSRAEGRAKFATHDSLEVFCEHMIAAGQDADGIYKTVHKRAVAARLAGCYPFGFQQSVYELLVESPDSKIAEVERDRLCSALNCIICKSTAM